jgi:peptidoglycan/xylan/chitin deacetylase (PgdA/CDA1 family)
VVGRPLDALVRSRLTHPCVVVLIYHRVGGRSPSPVDIPRARFAAQLDRLVEDGRVVDLDSAVHMVMDSSIGPDRRGEGDEQPFVVLTFDDGTADWVDEALPELVERGLPATFYVSTDFVENARPFPDGGVPIGWSGLGELVSSGLATIGSHTHTHRVLANASACVATEEIDRSIGLIEERLGVGCDHFAYPKAIRPSAGAEHVVRRRFASATLAGNRVNPVGRTDPHRIGRHGLTVADDMDAYRRKLRGGARLEGSVREKRDEWTWTESGDVV